MKNKLLIFGLLVPVITSCYAGSQYKRSECISRVDLFWTVDGAKKYKVMEQIQMYVIEQAEKGGLPAVPDMAFSGSEYSKLYFQFPSHCENKREMSANLMKASHKTIGVKFFPQYSVSDELIFPSPKTIDVQGDQWVD